MKLVILDRDGVINFDSPAYIKSADEWRAIPGSLEAIATLHQQGYKIAIASNQSGIGRGLFTEDSLQAIQAKLQQQLAELNARIDFFAFCPHAPEAHCACRKPLPGLFHQIAAYFGCDLTGIPAIGDSLRDIEAALAVQAQPLLVLTGNGQKTLTQLPAIPPIPVFENLKAAVSQLLGRNNVIRK